MTIDYDAMLLLSSLFLSISNTVNASVPTNQACDQAAAVAAKATGVPLDVLLSVTRIETGRNRNGKLAPWPWTVNMEGKGVWFATEDEARAYVYKNYKTGARSFDIGCFQINYKWHGQEFSSIEDMFDPSQNATYAATFLLSLYNEKGTWKKAAGAFHSRTEKFASKYEKRFFDVRQTMQTTRIPENLTDTPNEVVEPNIRQEPVVQENGFPLLKPSQNPVVLGSLVPLDSGQAARRFVVFGPNDG